MGALTKIVGPPTKTIRAPIKTIGAPTKNIGKPIKSIGEHTIKKASLKIGWLLNIQSNHITINQQGFQLQVLFCAQNAYSIDPLHP